MESTRWRFWTGCLGSALLAAALLTAVSCRPGAPPVTESESGEVREEEPAGPPLLEDVTRKCGVDWTYHNGEEAGHFSILETLGGGVGLLDYDGDGRLDIFLTGGGHYQGRQILGYPNRLYRNLGNWKFQDVAEQVGLDRPLFYTHGCAVADYDCDGWPDLLVTGWGRLALFHNEPDGKGGRRFAEVTAKAGLTYQSWSSSAAWADLDGDGYPDLYVCYYVDWSFQNNPECLASWVRDVCGPMQFAGLPHKLFRNNRDGTFSDVSAEAGLRKAGRNSSKGLGVLAADLNGDGKPDLYVANDTTDNFLYVNQSSPGRIRFREEALPSGTARDGRGMATGSMGVDAADYDGSGRPSLWVTNYENEMHSLFRNDGGPDRPLFTYRSTEAGVSAIGQHFVAWGTGFLELDNDGREDLVVSNGHAFRHPHGGPAAQNAVLLGNLGGGRFQDITRRGGSYFERPHHGRGLALGDLDNDGRTDLVISHLNRPVTVLRNVAPEANHWLGVELAGKGRRDVVGARLVLETEAGRQTRFAKGGGSYLSSSDRRHLFGLGRAKRVGRLTVTWPDGTKQHWDGLAVDRYHRLAQGECGGTDGSR